MTQAPSPETPRIVGWRDGASSPLFAAADVGAPSPLESMVVERCETGPDDGSQRRALRSHVLTLFVRGGLIDHAVEALPSRRIVVPREAVVCSLRDMQEEVRFAQDAELFAVELSDAFLSATARGLHGSEQFALTPSPGLRDPRLSGLMMALRAEQAAGWPAGLLFAQCIQQALATLLLGVTPASVAAPSGLSPRLARRVETLVEDELASPLRLEDLAAATGYSVAQFTRLFRATFGTSAHHYVMTRRIQRARMLLRTTRRSQLEIALECGFLSQQHFSRVFRARIGIGPKAYREQG